MTEQSPVVASYYLVIKQLVDQLLQLEHNDIAAEAIPIEVLPTIRSVDKFDEEDQLRVHKLHQIAMYLASFSNFVLKKRKSLRRSQIPESVSHMGLLLASRVLIITATRPSTIGIELKKRGYEILDMVGLKPALRALLNSTMFGACILECSDPHQVELCNLDSDLQSFVGRGGNVLGFGTDFVELCNRVFFSKWGVDPIESSEVALSQRIVPDNQFHLPLVTSSILRSTLTLQTRLINNVAESECIYEAANRALEYTPASALSLLVNKTRHPRYSTRSGFAVGSYGSGNFCYCGSEPLVSNQDILQLIKCILSHSLSTPHEALTKVPELPTSAIKNALWHEEKFDYDDTDDEEGIPLIEALPNFARLRDAMLRPKVIDMQTDYAEASVEEIDSNPHNWLCRCWILEMLTLSLRHSRSCGFKNQKGKLLCLNCFFLCNDILEFETRDTKEAVGSFINHKTEINREEQWICNG